MRALLALRLLAPLRDWQAGRTNTARPLTGSDLWWADRSVAWATARCVLLPCAVAVALVSAVCRAWTDSLAL